MLDDLGAGSHAFDVTLKAKGVLFEGFIRSWRTIFGKPTLPFVWCQLAPLGPKAADANEGTADGVWRWADAATICGETVEVSAKDVPQPVAVRYGWSKNPWVNLYNADGLPDEPYDSRGKIPGLL